jgi:hypothetical protein
MEARSMKVFIDGRNPAGHGAIETLTDVKVIILVGWVRRRYRYHPLPEELGVRLTPHPAQATGR